MKGFASMHLHREAFHAIKQFRTVTYSIFEQLLIQFRTVIYYGDRSTYSQPLGSQRRR